MVHVTAYDMLHKPIPVSVDVWGDNLQVLGPSRAGAENGIEIPIEFTDSGDTTVRVRVHYPTITRDYEVKCGVMAR